MPNSPELNMQVTGSTGADISMQVESGGQGPATNAEAWAVGERHGQAVPSTDPTYHNNSKYYAEQASSSATTANTAKDNAVTAKNDAVTAKNSAVTAKNDAVTAKNAAVDAKNAAETALTHQPKIENGTWWIWNTASGAYVNTNVKATGDAWHVTKTYASVSAMNADYSGSDTSIGDFVMIVSNVEDPDNAKVYVKGSSAWVFVVDMSGATGIQGPVGPTPNLTIGTVTDVPYSTGASATLTGTAANPVLNLQIPHGPSGNETIDDTAGIGDDDVVFSADRVTKEYVSQEGRKANADSISVYKERSGDIVTVEDAVSEAVKRMQIAIAPVQDLHGYDRPWVGGAGKNLFNEEYPNISSTGINYVAVDVGDGQFTLSTNCPLDSSNKAVIWLKNATGAVSTETNGVWNGQSRTVTSVSGKVYIYYKISSVNPVDYNVQLESGSVATSYTPYSNICPISGWTGAEVVGTGRNLVNENSITLYNRYIYISNNVATWTNISDSRSFYIKVEPNTTYTVSVSNPSSDLLRVMAASKEPDAGTTSTNYVQYSSGNIKCVITTGADEHYLIVQSRTAYLEAKTAKIQIEKGDIAHTYEPFGKVYSITFPTESAVYGGTLTVEQDGSGTLVVDTEHLVYDGSNDESWAKITSGSASSFGMKLNVGSTYSFGVSKIKSNYLQTIDPSVTWGNFDSWISWDGTTQIATGIKSVTTVEAWKTYLSSNNLEVLLKLATPVTYTLTAPEVLTLLNGYNTIYADCGDITVLYPAEKYLTSEQADRERIHETVATPADVMTISDGADNVTVSELKVAIEPVQNLHGYANPWVGGAGKNLLNPAELINKGLDSNGSESSSTNSKRLLSGYIPVTAGSTYYASCESGKSFLLARFYNSSKTALGSANLVALPLTAPEGSAYLRVVYYENNSGDIAPADLTAGQVELGSSATAFAPYSNICPISGFDHAEVTRTGKNLFDKNISIYEGRIRNDDGTESSSGSSNYTYPIGGVLPNTKYTIQGKYCNEGTNVGRIYFLDKHLDWISRQGISGTITFQTPANCYYLELQYIKNASDFSTIQIEKGESASAYESFGATYPITFPTSAGTVYGGELTVNWDGSGTLVVDRGFKQVKDLWWTLVDDQYTRFRTEISNLKRISTVRTGTILSDMLITCNDGRAIGNVEDFSVYQAANNQDIYIKDTLDATADAFRTRVGDAQLIYELEAPVTYSLTAPIVRTLLGINNIWSNTGKINSLSYSADIKTYIDNYGQTEEDFTANANIANGEYFQIGNTLYIATSAIASGETIIPGTNCTKTTIAEVLNADATGMSF